MQNARPALSLPPWSLAVGSMLSVQLASALSVHLIPTVGPAGLAWLRMTFGAIIFLAIARPPVRSASRSDVFSLTALGLSTGMVSVMSLAALDRIHLGTAISIQFLGPLTVAALRSSSRMALFYPIIAGVGVVLLTSPWEGETDARGTLFAFIAAFGWGAYILLTQRVGDRFAGVSGLSFTIPVAAVTAGTMGVPQAMGDLTPTVLLAALGLAVMLPVLPCALEMVALRHMTPLAFGTLMALEPAVAVGLGFLLLSQELTALQGAGLVLVVVAGAAGQRGGRRSPPPHAALEGLPGI